MMDRFDYSQMEDLKRQAISKMASVHREAGHEVDEITNGIRCDCGITVSLDLSNDRFFGWGFDLYAVGRGKPFMTSVHEEMHPIIFGYHPVYGVGISKPVFHTCPECGQSVPDKVFA